MNNLCHGLAKIWAILGTVGAITLSIMSANQPTLDYKGRLDTKFSVTYLLIYLVVSLFSVISMYAIFESLGLLLDNVLGKKEELTSTKKIAKSVGQSNMWTCSKCYTKNYSYYSKCQECNLPKPQ